MPTAFVTGATGFLGLNVVEQLVARDWQVTALHRPTANITYLQKFPVNLVTGAIDDANSLKDAIPEGVDAVFHVAGDTSLWSGGDAQQNRTNIDGTRNMVDASLAADAKRFIHTSSIAAYGLIAEPYDETTAQRGGEAWINYFRSKFHGEQEVRKGIDRGLDAVILNPPHIVGRYDTSNWARMIVMVDRQKLPGVPPGGGSFTHGEAVAKAHLAAFERGRIGENYLLAGVDSNYLEFIKIVGELLGRKVPKRAAPGFLLKTIGRINAVVAAVSGKEPDITPEGAALVCEHPYIASTKAKDELGFEAVGLRTMVEDSFNWLKQIGMLTSK